ncbi:MAG TPA: hypothetical protein VLL08_27805 [Kineosporiaceae bacterium]|nr:hypothetical protein [Kineosporiaceae bacterium]
MNFTLKLTPLLVAGMLVILALVLLTLIARSWRGSRTGLTDRLRIDAAVGRYDLWLELRGASYRRRRDLRTELRANLNDAAEQVGTGQALAALGSLRQMAAEATGGAVTGPRWSTGASAAAGALVVVILAELWAIATWVSAAEASGATRVQGSLPLFPGSLVTWERVNGGLSIDLDTGWLVIAAAAIAFVLGSRPWLAVSRHRSAGPV